MYDPLNLLSNLSHMLNAINPLIQILIAPSAYLTSNTENCTHLLDRNRSLVIQSILLDFL